MKRSHIQAAAEMTYDELLDEGKIDRVICNMTDGCIQADVALKDRIYADLAAGSSSLDGVDVTGTAVGYNYPSVVEAVKVLIHDVTIDNLNLMENSYDSPFDASDEVNCVAEVVRLLAGLSRRWPKPVMTQPNSVPIIE